MGQRAMPMRALCRTATQDYTSDLRLFAFGGYLIHQNTPIPLLRGLPWSQMLLIQHKFAFITRYVQNYVHARHFKRTTNASPRRSCSLSGPYIDSQTIASRAVNDAPAAILQAGDTYPPFREAIQSLTYNIHVFGRGATSQHRPLYNSSLQKGGPRDGAWCPAFGKCCSIEPRVPRLDYYVLNLSSPVMSIVMQSTCRVHLQLENEILPRVSSRVLRCDLLHNSQAHRKDAFGNLLA